MFNFENKVSIYLQRVATQGSVDIGVLPGIFLFVLVPVQGGAEVGIAAVQKGPDRDSANLNEYYPMENEVTAALAGKNI